MGKLIYIVSALVGVISGYVSNNGILSGSFWNLLFWAGIGIAIGCFASEKREAFRAGIIYGIFLNFTFLFFDFRGTSDELFLYTALACSIALISAIGGLVASFLGFRIWGRFRE